MYKINEIFYSLQGEGRWTGRPAVFVRFSGCNLACPFCDTDFHGFSEMTAEDIVERCKQLGGKCRFVILTGGEPTLQVDDLLVETLHQEGFFISMETNGTRPCPQGIDWVTCSPKDMFCEKAEPVVEKVDELKVVYDDVHPIKNYEGIHAAYRYLQPCDIGNKARNVLILSNCIRYIKANPEWQLSIQTHKVLGIR